MTVAAFIADRGWGLEHHRVRSAGGPAGIVRGLVQLVGRQLGCRLRPQGVHHLLAVQPAGRREREELDQPGGGAAVEPVHADRFAVDLDGELAQQPHRHRHSPER
jgi:hypothetical protein